MKFFALAMMAFFLFGCETSKNSYEPPRISDPFKILKPETTKRSGNELAKFLRSHKPAVLPSPLETTPLNANCIKPVEVNSFNPTITPELPLTVFLSINTSSGYTRCSGAFVEENLIVTAAHCFYGPSVRSVTAYPGVHYDQNGVLITLGSATASILRSNPRFTPPVPGKLTLAESKEDYAFVILRDSSLWKTLGSPSVMKFGQMQYPSTGGIAGGEITGKKYEYLGYPVVGYPDVSLDTSKFNLYRFDPGFPRKKSNFVAGMDQDHYPGGSGGVLREEGTLSIAGIVSTANRSTCESNYVVPHADVLSAFGESRIVAECVKTSDTTCEVGCCSRKLPSYPTGSGPGTYVACLNSCQPK